MNSSIILASFFYSPWLPRRRSQILVTSLCRISEWGSENSQKFADSQEFRGLIGVVLAGSNLALVI